MVSVKLGLIGGTPPPALNLTTPLQSNRDDDKISLYFTEQKVTLNSESVSNFVGLVYVWAQSALHLSTSTFPTIPSINVIFF